MAHAQWLQMQMVIKAQNARTDRCRIFKLAGGVEHITIRDQCPRLKRQRSKSQGQGQQKPRTQQRMVPWRCQLETWWKLPSWWLNVGLRHISRPIGQNKQEIEIWWTFCLFNENKLKIAEPSLSVMKQGSRNQMTVQNFHWKLINSCISASAVKNLYLIIGLVRCHDTRVVWMQGRTVGRNSHGRQLASADRLWARIDGSGGGGGVAYDDGRTWQTDGRAGGRPKSRSCS